MPPGPLIRAAVLVPIVDRGEAHLVFIQRSDRVGSTPARSRFPAAGSIPTIADDLHAALREAHEEVALPPASVEPLGMLDDTETFATQYVITPWVGLVHGAVAWQPDGHEIERVIEVPVGRAAGAGLLSRRAVGAGRVVRDVYFYDYGDTTIWGATARILKQYLDIVESE